MATQKPSIPKGTRDFSPLETARRNYIFDTIREVFRLYGYEPLETPTMENLSTLTGKYGEEGDKLLFKILNSGDFTKGVNMSEPNPAKLSTQICEKGLRYDLTVPFARYVVQHQNEITFPFKRYQIQPVWRADRPQKGRYREFYQCDVDVVGTTSLLCEVELIQIVQDIFEALNVRVQLKFNNRKILFAIAETIGFADKMIDITIAIDKLDKIGIDAVNKELSERGLSQEAISKIQPILSLNGTNRQKIEQLKPIIHNSPLGQKGIEEVTEILNLVDALGITLPLELDLSLARGLNYYTGAIFEVKALDFQIGSISGGGRYDDLTGIFGLPDTSGVGISFGADRIYDVLLGLDLFPVEATRNTKAMFVNFGGDELIESLKLLKTLREKQIAAEIYPEPAKIKKQFDYATKKGIAHMIFIGSDEVKNNMATVKNINTGEQFNVPFAELADKINEFDSSRLTMN